MLHRFYCQFCIFLLFALIQRQINMKHRSSQAQTNFLNNLTLLEFYVPKEEH